MESSALSETGQDVFSVNSNHGKTIIIIIIATVSEHQRVPQQEAAGHGGLS